MDPFTYQQMRNKTLLFFVEKLLESEILAEENGGKRCRTLHDLSCQFGSKGFTREMRQIAGGSQSGLKKFFQEYPSIFEIKEGDLVGYKEFIQQDKRTQSPANVKGGTAQNEVITTSNQAAEYFRQRMLQYGMGVWVPIKSLLGHRSQAPAEIRHTSGQHFEEFKNFLLQNPPVFRVQDDQVILTEFVDGENSCKKKLSIMKEKILKLIEFYGEILQQRGPMLLEQLFHLSYKIQDNDEKQSSIDDLSSFFQMHKEFFQLHSSLVTLSDSYHIALTQLKRSRKEKESQISQENEEEHVKIIVPNIVPVPPVPLLPNKDVENKRDRRPPTLKTRFNDILLKTIQQNSNSASVTDKIKQQVPQNSYLPLHESLEDEELFRTYIFQHTQIVSNIKKAREILQKLDKLTAVAVDLEGVNLGNEQQGQITLVQVCSEGNVFIFDVLTQAGIFDELKGFLENTGITKVLHDCRNDSSSLYRERNIVLQQVFDTQSAHVALTNGSDTKNASLNKLCEVYGVAGGGRNWWKDKIKTTYRHDPRFWSRRPLTKPMMCYAAADVLCLELLHAKMGVLIRDGNEDLKNFFGDLCQEQVLAQIHPEEIRQRRKLRKNERDLILLKAKIEQSLDDEDQNLVLSNRELRLLKHLTLSESAKEKLKNSLKIAKKLEKLEQKSNHSNSDHETGGFKEEKDDSSEPSSFQFESQSLPEFHFSSLNFYAKQDIGTQTNSTGDVVVLNVFCENE